MPKLVLASTSKYRRALLDRLGLSYSAHPPKVDEEAVAPGLAVDAVALALAQDKAHSVAATCPDAHIIGSDQLVDLDGERLGKPGTIERAEEQLRRLSGREHRLVTAVALRHPDGKIETALDVHVMRLRALTDAEVRRYVQRERPIDCAGSYKIESLGISLVESIEGEDFTAIVGLPLIALCKLLRAAGFEVPLIVSNAHHLLRTLFAVLFALAVYELLLRSWILGKLREGLHQRAHRYAEQHGVRVDLFKYGGRLLVKEELLNDPQVNEAMRESALGGPPLKTGQAARPPRPPEEVRRDVESYIDEIVPAFSLAAYYQFGMGLAKAAIHAVYRPVIDRVSQERLRALPKDATAVYLINHRSNFDYVVVGWALARQVALSYAVGEWARVFPLDALFKAFGGFFVRRGFPDPLYHQVLRRYLQLITRKGVTQGIFPEGGLTRDGALRTPKVGLLDALLQLTCEPGYQRELIFVPVGINYDRVLEDEQLLAEKRGRENPPTILEKLLGALKMLVLLPFRIVLFIARALTGRLQRGGYVAVAFGKPVRFSDWSREHQVELASLSDDERRNTAKQVAADLMKEIARVIPATPVPLVARAMLELGETTRERLSERVRELRGKLDALGVPVALGEEFAGTQAEQAALEADEHRNRDMSRLTGDMIASEEAEAIARLGVQQLARRGLLLRSGANISIANGANTREVLTYYSNSLTALD